MSDIDLGFAEECESKWLTNANFPSKIGGRPAWLDLDDLPTTDTLRCKKCGKPKSFLCQIYAPFEDDHNFHRTIFVFVCRTESCYVANDNSQCITALRSQLPMRNRFYSAVPTEDGVEVPEVLPPKLKLCATCGCVGKLLCSRCRKVNYCGPEHQRLQWKYHKLVCSAEKPSDEQKSAIGQPIQEVVFPEWEICMNPDDESVTDGEGSANKTEVNEEEQLQELDKLISSGKAGQFQNLPESELEKYTSGCEEVDDKDFRKFRKECAAAPRQVIRYMRKGAPLWIANKDKIKDVLENIPACSICGTPREFEFQIMPQMLNYLQDSSLDWGVLAIYTCPNSCPLPGGKGYTEEFVIKQDIVVDNDKSR
ncbi:programmed cell death protein 2 [Musca vetustissima]|uniref:programmed cell death protein 2 n=1 Tax=Musca vetustissima TaxID=27455 RepID=UPI002AB6858C|nr:programmed cell death protein 2 [Musca vetustissima]